MKRVLITLLLSGRLLAQAGDLDTIGVSLLRQIDPSLTGSGIRVAQPESSGPAYDFEVNPAAVGQPQGLFTWISSSNTATTFPNSAGTESSHANSVGSIFYGSSFGVSPGVSHVDNYEANYFYQTVVAAIVPTNLLAKVVNQSFIFGSEVASVDQNYDNYAAQFKTLFVSSAGNGGSVSSPGTAYNGLDVGVYGFSSSVGPTLNGRCKPDIVAPGNATSFSAPYVSGAAAVLLQAANRGDGGTNTSAASDLCTIKALLLNGAVKPSDWTNSPAHPLDLRYGSGIVNVFNSWKQLTGGKRGFVEATSYNSGDSHPPGSNTNNIALVGWDFNSITNFKSAGNYRDRVHHYYFNVPPTNGESFTFTASLIWNRNSGESSIRNLDLFLFKVDTGTLIASSTSTVDNVEHLFQNKLSPGRYDLQVMKTASGVTLLTDVETYALAFETFNLRLNLTRTNNNILLSWPVSPAGFALQSTTNLIAPSWPTFLSAVTVSNGQNTVNLSPTDAQRFFRLQRP